MSVSPDTSFTMRNMEVFNGAKGNITELDIIEEYIAENGDRGQGDMPPPHLPGPSPHLPGPSPHLPGPSSHLPGPSSHLPGPSSHLPGPSPHLPGPSPHLPGPSPHLSGPSPHLPGPPPPPAELLHDLYHTSRDLDSFSTPVLVARGTASMAPCSFPNPFLPSSRPADMASAPPRREAPRTAPSGGRGRGASGQAGPQRPPVGPSSRALASPRSSTEQLESLLEKPKLVVAEQPKERGMRFRYECEGRSAGSILGASSTGTNKIQPAIEIQGCIDKVKRVTVTVSLVTKDIPYRPHPHCLVGKDCPEGSGICMVSFNPHTSPQHSFANLGIQCVRRKELDSSLQKRRSQNIDPFSTGQSKSIEDMDMNVVRLCFQCDLEFDDGRKDCLSPVVSNPIYDKKATTTSQLKISCLNINKGSCTGTSEIYMLCDKVQKDDIEIVFRSGSWEAKGEFAQTDVHRQIAIVFKTPPYQEQDITEEVEVEVVLRRISDRMDSEPVSFTYLPHNPDPYEVKRKRKMKTDTLTEQACGAGGPSAHSTAMELSSPPACTGFTGLDGMAELLPPARPDPSSLGDAAYNETQDYDLSDETLLLTQLMETPTFQAMLYDPSLNPTALLEPGAIAGSYGSMEALFTSGFTYGQDFSQYNDMQFNHMVSESQPEPLSQEPGLHNVQVKTEEDL